MKQFVMVTGAAVVSMVATGAIAATATFNDVSTFLAAAGTTTQETFDALPAGTDYSEGVNYSFTGFSMSYAQGSGSSDMGVGIRSGTTQSDANINGSNQLAWGEDTITNGSGSIGPVLTFSFGPGASAFGFFWGDNDSTDSYSVTIAGTEYTDPPFAGVSPSQGTGFWGIVSDTPFTTAVFETERRGGFVGDMGMDDVYVSGSVAPIPLPAAGWMLLAGLGGLGVLRRRQKRHAA
jgi:hypothetical protein